MIPATTTAAVWRGGGRVRIEDIPIPPLGPREVLVRVRLATVCGSDRHTVSGRRPAPCPSILGHEATGVVEAVGPAGASCLDGSPVAVGDRVTWSVTVPCGQCDRCAGGVTAKCRTVRKTGHEPLDGPWPLSGGYAKHVVLPRGSTIVRVPRSLPDAVAAPAACATATVMAALDRAGAVDGRRVLVIGAGMLGLTAIAACSDAAEIIAADPDSDRRGHATRFGANRVLATVAEASEVDVVLDFSGSSAAIDQALPLLDIGGTAVLAGSVTPSTPLAVDPEQVVRRHLTITGVHNYEPRHLGHAIDFLAHTDAPWTTLTAPAAPLADLTHLLTTTSPTPRVAVVP
ncbi:zinc-binding dehydrogenase [Amycolatopsis taiwanensis]|uniref:zinc-binding dehydrogenase n=1 Tax=Amycolatopsis taiwanensis TaxID=342230 RepID=UPI000485C48A|nr:zinc-binding dehydrogenase [Amycolatopsis taiwanensis]